MICFTKPALRGDLYTVYEREHSITRSTCDTYTWQTPNIFIRDKPTSASGRVLHKEYNRKYSLEKNSGRESQGAWRQDEMIGGKPPVVKCLWLCFQANAEMVPKFQAATACFSCNPPELNLSKLSSLTVKAVKIIFQNYTSTLVQ
jgi:hypothetical protein